MSSAPSSPPPPPPPAHPSVFISYASEDRAAARTLRDTLAAAGLVVWYDENELGGGDAWDQKIRREIRDCDYFMPLVSAATERRKEGYFRREWRLAAERTLDMADDVLFLLPLVLDDTPETGARVPDKFNTVQWLRVPGGRSTPALEALIKRLLAGEHTATPRPPLVSRPTKPSAGPAPGAAAPGEERPAGPPPMPPFPHAPTAGGIGPWARFCAEILWWLVTAVWILVMRLPKWARILLALWFVATLVGTCSDRSTSRRPPPREKEISAATPAAPQLPKAPQSVKSVEIGIEHVVEALAKNPNLKDWARVGEDVARRLGAQATAEKRILLAPVAGVPDDSPAAQFAQRAFASCYGRLALAAPGAADVLHSAAPQATDAALVAAARAQRADLVLAFRLEPATGTPASLSVRVLRVRQSAAIWSGDFPLVATEAAAAGEKVAAEALAALPKK